MGFLWWIVIGLVAGALARLVVPGPQPMGCLLTLVLGLVGSLVGGLLASLIWGAPPGGRVVHATGLIGSTLGAIIVLLVYSYYQRRPRI
jgi:uncharacterized membrane protein YeaQ/YmgE (transglycosylase-associated protein family)